MTTKHTPGPWQWQQSRGNNIYEHKVITNDQTIAELDGWSAENTQANAQLIAAVPELLAACKLAQKYVAKMVADNVQTAMPPQVALNRIEQAINKAEGKA